MFRWQLCLRRKSIKVINLTDLMIRLGNKPHFNLNTFLHLICSRLVNNYSLTSLRSFVCSPVMSFDLSLYFVQIAHHCQNNLRILEIGGATKFDTKSIVELTNFKSLEVLRLPKVAIPIPEFKRVLRNLNNLKEISFRIERKEDLLILEYLPSNLLSADINIVWPFTGPTNSEIANSCFEKFFHTHINLKSLSFNLFRFASEYQRLLVTLERCCPNLECLILKTFKFDTSLNLSFFKKLNYFGIRDFLQWPQDAFEEEDLLAIVEQDELIADFLCDTLRSCLNLECFEIVNFCVNKPTHQQWRFLETINKLILINCRFNGINLIPTLICSCTFMSELVVCAQFLDNESLMMLVAKECKCLQLLTLVNTDYGSDMNMETLIPIFHQFIQKLFDGDERSKNIQLKVNLRMSDSSYKIFLDSFSDDFKDKYENAVKFFNIE